MDINKIRQNFGIYVTCMLIGTGVGMFIGHYLESREDEEEGEDDEVVDAVVVDPPPDEGALGRVVVPVMVKEKDVSERYNYVIDDKPALEELIDEVEVEEPRYMIQDLINQSALPSGIRILVNPTSGKFYRELDKNTITPITTDNVFGPDDEQIRSVLIEAIKADPGGAWGVWDDYDDIHYLVLKKKGTN
jgi:hypothetical protein